MSRVHDALRKAEQSPPPVPPSRSLPAQAALAATEAEPMAGSWLDQLPEVEFDPAPDNHLISIGGTQPAEAPAEEFRTLRTRMNHLQGLQPIRTLVVTSPCPSEGKSFTAANLAIAEAHLAANPTCLTDFDFRRPVLHRYFNVDREPGLTDYLQEKAGLPDIMKRVAGTNLCVIPAGASVMNPLELLNLTRCKQLLEELPRYFNWVILDTPPLLFAADASLLGTLCHGTLLVVRVGSTTIDSVARAMQSLCQNNVLGIVANGASRGELYSKSSYYGSYYYRPQEQAAEEKKG